MKAISVKQPWASLIASGRKTIETRTWATEYRGPLLICSSKAPRGVWPAGVALCVVELVGCRRMEARDWARAMCDPYRARDGSAAFGWFLDHVRPVAMFPVRGQLGVFEVEAAITYLV